jgi:hypothetical protein
MDTENIIKDAKKLAGQISYADLFKPGEFRIEKLWILFSCAVLPDDVAAVQHDDMRKAFYAGFLECFKVMTDYASDLSEEDACKVLSSIADQVEEFLDGFTFKPLKDALVKLESIGNEE